jgi:hypothetical protein
MASGAGTVTDIVVPELFSPYVQQLTEEKSRIIQSGAVVRDAALDGVLAGGGLTFNEPSFKDLDNDADNVASATLATTSTPNKIGTATEIQVRLSRNNSWSSGDLAADLAGADPMNAIASRVSSYWVRRLQAAFVATITGVYADNAVAPTGTEHTLNDMTHDISGGAFADGVTNFSAEGFLDAAVTMGDSMDSLGLVIMHSIVYNRALKNNLIDFVADAVNPNAQAIPTFLGRQVLVDDNTPRSSGVFQTWLFGAGSVRLGMGSPKVPTEVDRIPAAGNGSGQEVLYNRTEWCIHPVGCAYVGTAASGGPTNAATTNNLADAGSWARVFAERKQIKMARLITREF